MSRPEKDRIVQTPPFFTRFKPVGIRGSALGQPIKITLDEYEAFRLADYMGLSHEEASDEMEISRSTFTRLIEKARKKVASLIIDGKVLIIDGGNIHFRENIIQCTDCGHMFRININASIVNCPSCNSSNLLNFAGGFGHGRCCSDTN